jgi:CRISPR/Cas system-associated endonuclease/helicase Cas3
METQIALLTQEQINNRVRNGGNSFTKEEMLAHRDEIKLARKEKKEWLGGLNEAEQLDIVRAAIRNGFQLQDTKMSHLKRSDKFTPIFVRKDEVTALDNEEAKLLAKLEKIAARKAELNAVAA